MIQHFLETKNSQCFQSFNNLLILKPTDEIRSFLFLPGKDTPQYAFYMGKIFTWEWYKF